MESACGDQRSFVSSVMHRLAALAVFLPAAAAADPAEELADYFAWKTDLIEQRTDEAMAAAPKDWGPAQSGWRAELREMLGLDPLPERTPLDAQVTGAAERGGVRVENLHFQSRPGLYVTANLYLPAQPPAEKLPAILYVCGHGAEKKDGISYGNKVHYQHHGAWFAQNGYACLMVDSLQLGEIEALHHGTYREGMWWWNARGYTPAGVEAWNCVRALDYLESRPEIDAARLGVTGRSGGGAYSWWITALDDRIKASVPVAGITNLHNHVVDGCVEGHCDCMFVVNTYRWDYARVAALAAPRPLLIANSDKDSIFPLDGVVDVYSDARDLYKALGAEDRIGLHITEGPHSDTQPLRSGAFHWLNRHLRGTKIGDVFESAAKPLFTHEELRVFMALPEDQRNTAAQDWFVPAAPDPAVPENAEAWAAQRDAWRRALREKAFGGWVDAQDPAEPDAAFDAEAEGVRLRAWDFQSDGPIRLRIFLATPADLADAAPDLCVLTVLGDDGWREFCQTYGGAFKDHLDPGAEADDKSWGQTKKMFGANKWAMAYVAPRGIGLGDWGGNDRKRIQIRRRFMLLGETLDGARVWDTRRAIQALRATPAAGGAPLWLQGEGDAAAIALYASLFEPGIKRLDLHDLPASHALGPTFLNVLRFLDMPQAAAMAAERSDLRIYGADREAWAFPQSVAAKLGWGEKRIQLR